MESEKKNPRFPDWKIWTITLLVSSQVMTAFQVRQANQELWKTVVQQSQELVQQKQELAQLGQHLIEHQQNDILYKTTLNKVIEKETYVLEEWIQKIMREVRRMDLSKVKTSELVTELETREGVKMIIVEPYQNGEVSVEGPAVILVIMD